jgi:hypothetical protein
MSNEIRQTELREKTQQLLQGPLKHIRAAALAAALLTRGSNVAASSDAWTIGEPLHIQMDTYNNGLLCAPHRQ